MLPGYCLAFELSKSLLGQSQPVLVKSNCITVCEDTRSDAKSSVDVTVLFMIILHVIDPHPHLEELGYEEWYLLKFHTAQAPWSKY